MLGEAETGNVKVFGRGEPGGKGVGLSKINDCRIPGVRKLKTLILSTDYYDRFVEGGGTLAGEDLPSLAALLEDLGDGPISVRSSATNEAGFGDAGSGAVHAGENASFMLPNNHPDPACRLGQLGQAISHVYGDFHRRQPGDGREKMAIVLNPIPGVFDDSPAGPIYFPLVSGVADSYFPYALKTQDPEEGFARIAFGHGYATVLDAFPVITMATIRNPLPLNLLGEGQKYFYAVDMTKNESLRGDELETMRTLHVRFAADRFSAWTGKSRDRLTFAPLIENDHLGFRSGLERIMDAIRSTISHRFQIEFVFHPEGSGPAAAGIFTIVQLTQLPEPDFETLSLPLPEGTCLLSVTDFQGHGIKRNIRRVLVVSPFLYVRSRHDEVRRIIAEANARMRAEGASYILIVPGRLGSRNRDWGLSLEYRDIDRAAAIFEYGVDVVGRPEPVAESDPSPGGGIYGSHFLYMIQGGQDEDRKRLQARMFGTQGSHFLTNLTSNAVIYGFILPTRDWIDPRLFRPGPDALPLTVIDFPGSVTVYADTLGRRCRVIEERP
jgi:hypothetical protein